MLLDIAEGPPLQFFFDQSQSLEDFLVSLTVPEALFAGVEAAAESGAVGCDADRGRKELIGLG